MEENHSIHYGSATIVYTLVFKNRKSLGITVFPDKSVVVQAPVEACLDTITAKVKKRAGWIIKQQEFFSSFHPLTPPRQFVSGETHLYLGRQYRLRLIESQEPKVKLQRGYLEVYGPQLANGRVEKLLQTWYRNRAEEKIRILLVDILKKFARYELPEPILEFRKMDKRWGSCTPAGKIILNPDLIRAPKACIEYVLVHELCHLLIPNHTRAFFELQSRIFPDWEKWKDKLEKTLS